MTLKAVVFDRDDTLNKQAEAAHGYTLSPDEVVLLPTVKEALALLRQHGVRLFVFTQQRCIGKGLLTEEGLHAIHERLQALLGDAAAIEKFYFCPHLSDEGCVCSKPKPGMLLQFLAEYGFSPDEVLVVGDQPRDFEAAKAAGLSFAFVRHECAGQGGAQDMFWPEKYDAPVYGDMLDLAQQVLSGSVQGV